MDDYVYQMFVRDAFGVPQVSDMPDAAGMKRLERQSMRRLYDQNYLLHGEIWLFPRMPTTKEAKYFQEEGQISRAVDAAIRRELMTIWPRDTEDITEDE